MPWIRECFFCEEEIQDKEPYQEFKMQYDEGDREVEHHAHVRCLIDEVR